MTRAVLICVDPQQTKTARAHTPLFKYALPAVVCNAFAAAAAALHTCRAPRNDAQQHIATAQASGTSRRGTAAPAISKHGCRPVTLGDLVTHYLHHNSIITKLSAGR